MKTLQDTKTKILSLESHEIETGSLRRALNDRITENRMTKSSDNPASGTMTFDQPTADRFSPDFSDPDFPVKDIRYAGSKRLFDIVFSSLILAVLSPLLLVTALLVKATSKGPIFFKQTRVGRGGRYFTCYKFRSMCVDAEAKKKELMHLNEASGPVFKMKRDPRITPVGGFIRKFSIDELPQFFNVLRGEMSVVGPRPPIPAEVNHYSQEQRGRLAVKPGITCLWQIGGRSNVCFERWVELDLKYIETMSFKGDLMIVLKTVPAVIFSTGAH